MAETDFQLIVNGSVYGGWKSAQVVKSVKAFSSSFSLDVTDNWTGIGELIIKPGDICSLKINGNTVITGYVDSVVNAIEAESQTISVAGRDKTADLVDCAAVVGTGEQLNRNIFEIAKVLAEPLGVTVKLDSGVDAGAPFVNFSIQPGETVFEALTRAAKLRGMLWSTDGLGNLLLTKAGKTKAEGALILGENVKSLEINLDAKERYSEYIVKAQVSGTDEMNSAQASQIMAKATDATVVRKRPLIIIAEDQATTADAKKRAEWEAKTRAANAVIVTAKVAGFEQTQEGRLWDVNELVYVKSELQGLEEVLLVSDITMSMSNTGSETELKLIRQDAFEPEPVVTKANEPAQKL